jgi:hypothetical protein
MYLAASSSVTSWRPRCNGIGCSNRCFQPRSATGPDRLPQPLHGELDILRLHFSPALDLSLIAVLSAASIPRRAAGLPCAPLVYFSRTKTSQVGSRDLPNPALTRTRGPSWLKLILIIAHARPSILRQTDYQWLMARSLKMRPARRGHARSVRVNGPKAPRPCDGGERSSAVDVPKGMGAAPGVFRCPDEISAACG